MLRQHRCRVMCKIRRDQLITVWMEANGSVHRIWRRGEKHQGNWVIENEVGQRNSYLLHCEPAFNSLNALYIGQLITNALYEEFGLVTKWGATIYSYFLMKRSGWCVLNHLSASGPPIYGYPSIYLLWRKPLQWRHNGRDGISNHQPHDCFLNRLFIHRSKKTTKLSVTGLCARNSPEAGEFPHKWPVTRKMFPFDDIIMRLGNPHHMCSW